MKRSPIVRPAIGTGLILLIPLVMTYLDQAKAAGDGFHWSPLDFVVMGLLLFSAGLAYELIARRLRTKTHRILLGLAVLCVVLAIWVELAVSAISQLLAFLFG